MSNPEDRFSRDVAHLMNRRLLHVNMNLGVT